MRQFIHTTDLADAIFFATYNYDSDVQLNIANDEEISILNLANMISNLIGFRGETKWEESMPNGTLRKKLDVSLINSLGWSGKIKLEDGLKSTIEWFQNNYEKESIRLI
jgi:GDP-L-fucose synthase